MRARLEFKAVLKKIQPEAMQHLDHSEFHREARRMFDEADTNGSRRLCVKEFVRFYLDTMAREHERQRDLQEEQARVPASRTKLWLASNLCRNSLLLSSFNLPCCSFGFAG